jgi:hypothetical protein
VSKNEARDRVWPCGSAHALPADGSA